MEINAAGLAIIKEAEGLVLKPYLCPAGYWTQGYGHRIGVSHDSKPVTEAQADAWLREDVADAEQAVMARVRVPLNENEFSALVSFVFNIRRIKWNEEKCTLLRMLNDNAPRALVAEEFRRWNKTGDGAELPGLTKRRLAEKELFLTPVNPA